jgi:hypothetical protein
MTTRNFSVLNGHYTPAQAKELLHQMVKSAANFEKLQNYIMQVRYEENCDQAKSNLAQLTKTLQRIDELIAMAADDNYRLSIEASICITPVQEPHAVAVLA